MVNKRRLLFSVLSAVIFIALIGYISFGDVGIGFLHDFCFMFHLYTFGVSFSGGDTGLIIPYYIALLLVLTLAFYGIASLARRKNS